MLGWLRQGWTRYQQNRGLPETPDEWLVGLDEGLAIQREAALAFCDKLGVPELKQRISEHRPEEPVPSDVLSELIARDPKTMIKLDRMSGKMLRAHWRRNGKPWRR